MDLIGPTTSSDDNVTNIIMQLLETMNSDAEGQSYCDLEWINAFPMVNEQILPDPDLSQWINFEPTTTLPSQPLTATLNQKRPHEDSNTTYDDHDVQHTKRISGFVDGINTERKRDSFLFTIEGWRNLNCLDLRYLASRVLQHSLHTRPSLEDDHPIGSGNIWVFKHAEHTSVYKDRIPTGLDSAAAYWEIMTNRYILYDNWSTYLNSMMSALRTSLIFVLEQGTTTWNNEVMKDVIKYFKKTRQGYEHVGTCSHEQHTIAQHLDVCVQGEGKTTRRARKSNYCRSSNDKNNNKNHMKPENWTIAADDAILLGNTGGQHLLTTFFNVARNAIKAEYFDKKTKKITSNDSKGYIDIFNRLFNVVTQTVWDIQVSLEEVKQEALWTQLLHRHQPKWLPKSHRLPDMIVETHVRIMNL